MRCGGGGWSAPRPRPLYPPGEKIRYTLYRRPDGPPGPVCMGAENLVPPRGFDSRTVPAGSESLYRLSYRGRRSKVVTVSFCAHVLRWNLWLSRMRTPYYMNVICTTWHLFLWVLCGWPDDGQLTETCGQDTYKVYCCVWLKPETVLLSFIFIHLVLFSKFCR
jgi:hypothetical protein